MIKVPVPDRYRRVIERAALEKSRVASNMISAINGHIHDADDSYIESTEYKRFLEKTIDTFRQSGGYIEGAVYSIIKETEGKLKTPRAYYFEDEYQTLIYRTW